MAWNQRQPSVTRQQAEYIRLQIVGQKATEAALSARFNVSRSTIHKIAKTLWQHRRFWDRTSIDQPYWPPQPIWFDWIKEHNQHHTEGHWLYDSSGQPFRWIQH